MVRLQVIVEGQTEERFVRDVLAPFLWEHRVIPVARLVGTRKEQSRIYRGGLRKYEPLRRDLTTWLKQDRNPDARFTTMVDLHRLPSDFPGYKEGQRQRDSFQRVEYLESQFAADIDDRRFVPYIQLHEFEALLFAKPAQFAIAYPNRPRELQQLSRIRSAFESPEHIDDGDETAPSKRIKSVLPDYQKAAAGPVIAREIGMQTLLSECAHFAGWVRRLAVAASIMEA